MKNVAEIPLKNYIEAFEFVIDVGNKHYEEMQGNREEDPHTGEFDGYSQEWNGRGKEHITEGGGDHELPSEHKRDEL